MREIHILKIVRHPNIVQLYEIIETSKQLFLIMEYASGGELFDYVANSGPFNEKIVRYYAKQLIQSVHYIHTKGFAHRDLKCENILLDKFNRVKLCDFGVSEFF